MTPWAKGRAVAPSDEPAWPSRCERMPLLFQCGASCRAPCRTATSSVLHLPHRPLGPTGAGSVCGSHAWHTESLEPRLQTPCGALAAGSRGDSPPSPLHNPRHASLASRRGLKDRQFLPCDTFVDNSVGRRNALCTGPAGLGVGFQRLEKFSEISGNF